MGQNQNTINHWRIVFTYTIMAFHLFNSYGKATGWYIGVEFFFIVSGFLLAKKEHTTADDKASPSLNYRGGVLYVIHRIKQLYPHYLFSFIISFIVFGIINKYSLIQYIKGLYGSLPEIFMMSMCGLNLKTMINVPTWYLSVLIIAGYFLYTLLRANKQVFLYLLAPMGILVIYTYFYRYAGCIHYSSLGENIVKGLYGNLPLFRGVADMSVGILLYHLWLKKDFVQLFRQRCGKFVYLLESACYAFIIISSYFYSHASYDFLYILVLSAAIFISFSQKMERKDSRIVNFLAKLCYPMFLNHNMFRELLPRFVPELSIGLLFLYFIVVTLYSMITMTAVHKLLSAMRNWNTVQWLTNTK